jgi:hypothetical protein
MPFLWYGDWCGLHTAKFHRKDKIKIKFCKVDPRSWWESQILPNAAHFFEGFYLKDSKGDRR